jgi:site-specific DNA-methyltransferase (adenine-specific)
VTTAYNEDCLAAMKKMPDKCFDLAVVDPPYGIGIQSMTYTNGGGEREKFGHMAAVRRNYKRPET